MATLLEAFAFFEFLAAWLLIALDYRYFPALIFLPGGSFFLGTRMHLWALLFVATFLYLLLNRLPRRPNFAFNRAGTPEPLRRQAAAMLLWTKVVLMAIFLTIALAAKSGIVPNGLLQTMRALPYCLLLILIVFPVQILRTRRSGIQAV